MKLCVKRFILPLGCLVLGLALRLISRQLGGNIGGTLDGLVLFVLFPATVLTLIWAAWKAVWSLYWVHIRGTEWPREQGSLYRRWKQENRMIRKEWQQLNPGHRAVYILLRAGGIILAVAGIVLVCLRRYALGDVLLAVGLLLHWWSRFRRYNEIVSSIRSVPLEKQVAMRTLFRAFRGVLTELGTPYLGRVRFVQGTVLIFGPDDDGRFIYLRRNRLGSKLQVVLAPSDYLISEELTDRLRGPEDYGKDLPRVGNRVLLEAIAEMTGRYLKNGTVQLEFPAPEEPRENAE